MTEASARVVFASCGTEVNPASERAPDAGGDSAFEGVVEGGGGEQRLDDGYAFILRAEEWPLVVGGVKDGTSDALRLAPRFFLPIWRANGFAILHLPGHRSSTACPNSKNSTRGQTRLYDDTTTDTTTPQPFYRDGCSHYQEGNYGGIVEPGRELQQRLPPGNGRPRGSYRRRGVFVPLGRPPWSSTAHG